MSDSTLSTNSIIYNDFEPLTINIVDKDKIKNTINPNDGIFEKLSYYLRSSTITTRIIVGISLLIFVYKYLKIKKIKPSLLFDVIFSSNFLTISWIFTLLFYLYLYLLPSENIYIRYLKIRADDALKAYLIAVMAFYDLPLSAFWIIFFYDTLFITRSQTQL